ncbi:hypothetical protein IFT96_23405 [Pseudomonas fluorescens]|uniref:hypothetical protein n=1 Tax=Pseudomonas paracarnis TaxID=2750625 RepID=UPI0017867400|nr:hypothetical protein [Pseudomonas paracarnis]MBD8258322.1 hypothetical protein [Pseudomonas fluorescens]MDV3058550.1 hypothetical protein [Pseudomonas paracarnis]
MTQTAQEKFEAWHLARFPGASLSKRTNGEYINLYVGMCWIGWSASRETLVVELPTVGPSPEPPEDAIDDSFLDAHHAKIRMRNGCFMAIKAAGITIAGESN